jgi:hypothetical protein
MILKRAVVLAMISICCFQGEASGRTLSEWNDYVSQIVQQIRLVSTLEDRAVEDEITFIVLPTNSTNAFSTTSNGRRYVKIEVALLTTIEWLSTNEALTSPTRKVLCQNLYFDYLSNALVMNSERASTHVPLHEITSPFQFYSKNAAECPQISPAEANSDKDLHLFYDMEVQQMVTFVVAHEIGHQIYNDPRSEAVNWCEQQRRETRADAYALSILSKPGNGVALAFPVMFLFGELENLSGDDEGKSHPAAIKRLLKMIGMTRKQYAANPPLAEGLKGHEKEFYDGLNQMESGIRSELVEAQNNPAIKVCSD